MSERVTEPSVEVDNDEAIARQERTINLLDCAVRLDPDGGGEVEIRVMSGLVVLREPPARHKDGSKCVRPDCARAHLAGRRFGEQPSENLG